MKLLHIIATPRGEESSTLQISNAFLDELSSRHKDLSIVTVNTFDIELPEFPKANVDSKYGLMLGMAVTEENQAAWDKVETMIQQFLAADVYLISVPMWNFTIPYPLKLYLDNLVQPGYLFRYDEQGVPHGLATGKKMQIICSTGGNYSSAPMSNLNFVENYLRGIFGFCGITDIGFELAGPMNYTQEVKDMVMSGAKANAKQAASNF